MAYGFVDHVIASIADVLPARGRTIGLGQTA